MPRFLSKTFGGVLSPISGNSFKNHRHISKRNNLFSVTLLERLLHMTRQDPITILRYAFRIKIELGDRSVECVFHGRAISPLEKRHHTNSLYLNARQDSLRLGERPDGYTNVDQERYANNNAAHREQKRAFYLHVGPPLHCVSDYLFTWINRKFCHKQSQKCP